MNHMTRNEFRTDIWMHAVKAVGNYRNSRWHHGDNIFFKWVCYFCVLNFEHPSFFPNLQWQMMDKWHKKYDTACRHSAERNFLFLKTLNELEWTAGFRSACQFTGCLSVHSYSLLSFEWLCHMYRRMIVFKNILQNK